MLLVQVATCTLAAVCPALSVCCLSQAKAPGEKCQDTAGLPRGGRHLLFIWTWWGTVQTLIGGTGVPGLHPPSATLLLRAGWGGQKLGGWADDACDPATGMAPRCGAGRGTEQDRAEAPSVQLGNGRDVRCQGDRAIESAPPRPYGLRRCRGHRL